MLLLRRYFTAPWCSGKDTTDIFNWDKAIYLVLRVLNLTYKFIVDILLLPRRFRNKPGHNRAIRVKLKSTVQWLRACSPFKPSAGGRSCLLLTVEWLVVCAACLASKDIYGNSLGVLICFTANKKSDLQENQINSTEIVVRLCAGNLGRAMKFSIEPFSKCCWGVKEMNLIERGEWRTKGGIHVLLQKVDQSGELK